MKKTGALKALLLVLQAICASQVSLAGTGDVHDVPITFLEALAPRDSTSSEKFQKHFESTINLAIELVTPKLNACGYRLKGKTRFYSASDTLQAYENGMKEAQEGTWFIVSPRRTNHVLLVSKGAPKVPSVSVMASASEFGNDPIHLSIYSSNHELANGAVRLMSEIAEQKSGHSYFTILSGDCVTCRSFSKEFDEAARTTGIKKIGQTEVLGEDTDPLPAAQLAVASKAGIILLPNYSKISASLMGALYKLNPKLLFLGGDGWGDQKFGFVARNSHTAEVLGFSVRGFPTVEQGLKVFPLGRQFLKSKRRGDFIPESGPSLGILRIVERLSGLLCDTRPKNIHEFEKIFTERGREYFKSPWGVSAYRLKEGKIEYWKPITFQ